MSNVKQAAEFLRQAADALSTTPSTSPPASSTHISPSTSTSTATPSIQSRLQGIFGPYRGRSSTNRGRTRPRVEPAGSFWSHRFVALANPMQDTVPSRQEKQELFESGLGEQKITFIKNSDASYFKDKIETTFPKMKESGGFELLRTGSTSRVMLIQIKRPPSGYTAIHLSDSSNLGQALCFVRPIQRELSLSPIHADEEQVTSDECLEECLTCGSKIKLSLLREHASQCNGNFDFDDDIKTPVSPKKKYLMYQNKNQFVNLHVHASTSKEEVCPVCGKTFPVELLPVHAASCGDTIFLEGEQSLVVSNPNRSLLEEFDTKRNEIDSTDGIWSISVVRRLFMSTAVEQLEEADGADWQKTIRVNFIGEEGVDA